MPGSVLLGISYNGAHNKGDEMGAPEAVMVPPGEHAAWLLASVLHYAGLVERELHRRTRKIVVVASGLKPLLAMNAPGERSAMWVVHADYPVLSDPIAPGHQLGASACLRLGLEAAGTWGFDYYLHTAEDILPRPSAIAAMLAALDAGKDYAGYSWSDCLNCSFFACRTSALAGCFDREEVKNHRGLEHYLTHLLRDRPLEIFPTGRPGSYLTTHDYQQYRRWLQKMPDSDAPPCVRTMADYAKGNHLA